MRLPAGYVDYDRGAFRVIAPRLALDEMVALLTGPERDREPGADGRRAVGAATPISLDPPAVSGGRGWTRRLILPGGKTVYLRKYVRGGLARHFSRDLYVLRPERPVRELIVTETARAAGCPVPHVLAACVEEALIGYRGWLVTEAIEGARPLIDVYAERDAQRRPDLLAAVAAAIDGLQAAGVYHVDLNGHNVLVGPDDRISFVDFDRAYLAAAGYRRRDEAAHARLRRSMRKLAAERGLVLAAGGAL